MTIRFKAAATEGASATLTLMGEVGWDFGPADVSSALKQIKGQPLEVEIFSYGGDAFGGLAIYSQLKAHDGPVSTKVLGVAASAASAIFMAGDTRVMPKNGALMIHPAWSFAMGDADEMRKTADVLEQITNAYVDVYAEASGRPAAELEPYVKAESWLFGEEAFALSLSTTVGDDLPEASVPRMAIPPNRFNAMPRELITLLAAEVPAEPTLEPEPEPEPVSKADPEPAAVDPIPEPGVGSLNPPTEPAVASMTVTTNAREDERTRQNQIRALCSKAIGRGMSADEANSLADKYCADGTEVDSVRAHVFELITGATPQSTAQSLADHGAGNIGMSESELASYSVLNVVRYLADPSASNREKIGLELEAHRAAEQVEGQKPSDGGVLIPQDVLRSSVAGGWGFKSRNHPRFRAAGQEVGDFSKGGALVDTSYLAGSFIDEVYVRSAIMRTGMTMLTGLIGKVSIGKQLSGSTTYWVGENVDVNESELAFGLTGLDPKTIGVRVPFSRLSLKQTTPDVEMLARRDMTIKMALGIDKAFLYGTGNLGQPLGLCNHPGLAGVTFSGGADLVYPSKVGGGTHDTGSWADYVALEGQIASEELDVESMVYLMNSTTRSGCKTTLRAAAAGSEFVMTDNGQINGYNAIVSNQLQTNEVVFGNFADAIGGMWGAVDMVIDPYTKSASGQVVITMFQDVDFAVRYLESFVKGS